MDPARFALYRQLADAALIDASGASVLAAAHPGLAPAGTISAPRGDPAGADAAIAAAEVWLRDRGCTQALGPMEVCTWFPYRANLGPAGRPPFVMEPAADPAPWLARGYEVAGEYASSLHRSADFVEETAPHRARAAEAGLTLRRMDLDRFDDELGIIYRLSMTAFTRAFAYTPLPEPAFRALYAPLKPHIDPRMVLIAEDRHGAPAGFCFNLPEPLAPQLRQFVIKSLAVDSAWRQLGLGSWLVAESHLTALDQGLDGGGIHALMWSGSHSRTISAHAGGIFRRYALFRRDL
jgi:GNAT superfamily N-acetyltransferase